MGTFLITWNSSSDTWASFPKDAAKVKGGRRFVFPNWPIGHSKHLAKDDRLFVLKQSVEPRGIIGSGFAHSDWFAVGEGGPKQRTRTKNEIAVRLESLLDSEVEDILEQETLEHIGLDWIPFETRTGGIQITDQQAAELEGVWNQFLDGRLTTVERYPLAEVPAIEGKPEYRLKRHLRREAWKRKEKIDKVLATTGKLLCEVPGCAFDYVEKYGAIAKRYAHVHHKTPLSDPSRAAKTLLRDLAIVCATVMR